MSFSSGQKLRRGTKKPYQPAPGSDFDDFQQAAAIEARTRGFLARFLAISTAAALVITGGYGFLTRNYVPLEVVWAVAGPMVGALVA
jgi:hypothetical protein